MRTSESLGGALGKLVARIDAWRGQREQIADDLNALIRDAQGMLKDVRRDPRDGRMGSMAELARVGRRRGGRPKGFRMSAATKAKLRAAWKRRKAAAAKAQA